MLCKLPLVIIMFLFLLVDSCCLFNEDFTFYSNEIICSLSHKHQCHALRAQSTIHPPARGVSASPKCTVYRFIPSSPES